MFLSSDHTILQWFEAWGHSGIFPIPIIPILHYILTKMLKLLFTHNNLKVSVDCMCAHRYSLHSMFSTLTVIHIQMCCFMMSLVKRPHKLPVVMLLNWNCCLVRSCGATSPNVCGLLLRACFRIETLSLTLWWTLTTSKYSTKRLGCNSNHPLELSTRCLNLPANDSCHVIWHNKSKINTVTITNSQS